MQSEQSFHFGPYRLDPHTGQLWRGKQEVRLTEKASAVLRHLVKRGGQVVTKEDLFSAIWPDTVVSDAALTSCIQELRRALHDNARKPRYVETVHRRGFRFIAPLTTTPQGSGARDQGSGTSSPPSPDPRSPNPAVVGRDSDLAFLHERLARAVNGERQIVFVTGEPGIGKTTLLEVFVSGVQGPASHEERQKSKVETDPRSLIPVPQIGRGQCIEHYGAGEAYLPILEALGRLCRESGRERLIALLSQHAPSWLVQMPALLSAQELETLQRKTQGVTRERMLRELAEALEVVTREQPLVLVLEDLHWSDVSTLELLSLLARRREAARLLVIGSYRPVEVLTREHPLKGIKQELQVHGQCEELALDFLTEEHVAEYLGVRFGAGSPHPGPLPQGARGPVSVGAVQKLAHLVHQRTDGNPLFMVTVVNDLVAQGVVVQSNGNWAIQSEVKALTVGTPVNLRQLIEYQLARVSPDERTMLEAASVVGADFSAAAVAAGAEQSAEAVEARCDGLMRREQFLRARGTSEWPDGTITARYGFIHALYQEVLYEQISASRRIRLHRQIGEREEQGYSNQAGEIAAELAVHFERGRDQGRAVRYRQRAGENARRRNAHQEAANHFAKGLELLKHWPETPERTHQELTLQMALGSALVVTRGLGAHEARDAYDHARALCQRVGETPQLFPILYGLSAYYVQQGETITAGDLAEQCLTLAERRQDSALMVAAHRLLVSAWHWSGNPMLTHEHCERGMALYDPQQFRSLTHIYGMDPGLTCLSIGAWALWYLGYPDQALTRTQAALALAREENHPYTLAWVLNAASWTRFYRREEQAACALADEAIALSSTNEFPHWIAMGLWMRGQALIELGQWKEGTAQLQQGREAYRATGAVLGVQGCGLAEQAKGYGCQGEVEEGLQMIAEALAEVNQVRHYEAEMYRVKGELTLQQASQKSKVKGQKSKVTDPRPLTPDPQGEAEACFLKAIDIACKQQAKSWELRATTSLARLWQQQGKTKQAHKLLSEVYHWFTEGFDTKDLQEAQALLTELDSVRC